MYGIEQTKGSAHVIAVRWVVRDVCWYADEIKQYIKYNL